ncbi:hypothetical protein [Actinotalea sp. C106]|uniref:hypothetical protein n=1 Tax=Actinotalea sp. C106 TaxID=2908644 RepID=UPI002028306E|nr:hypothetical protein [Actinotalea sp. C106]
MTTGPGDALRAAVAARAQGTPYQVVPTPEGFDLRIDVVDARWYGLIGAAGLKKVVEHRVVLDEAARTLTLTDDHREVRWDGGVDASGAPMPRLVASAQVTRTLGRTYEFEMNRTWGIDQEGKPGRVVDFTFASAEGQSLIRAAAAEHGWKEKAGAAQRVGLAVGLAALALALVVGGTLAILGMTGQL